MGGAITYADRDKDMVKVSARTSRLLRLSGWSRAWPGCMRRRPLPKGTPSSTRPPSCLCWRRRGSPRRHGARHIIAACRANLADFKGPFIGEELVRSTLENINQAALRTRHAITG